MISNLKRHQAKRAQHMTKLTEVFDKRPVSILILKTGLFFERRTSFTYAESNAKEQEQFPSLALNLARVNFDVSNGGLLSSTSINDAQSREYSSVKSSFQRNVLSSGSTNLEFNTDRTTRSSCPNKTKRTLNQTRN